MADLIIGIDLGTTNSAVGIVEAGFPILLANEEGERLIPSVVWFGEEEVKVGVAALREVSSARTIRSAKRQIGLRYGEVRDGRGALESAADGGVAFATPSGPVTPVQVSAEILKELKRIAEFRLETEVQRAVISVPAYFNNAQREATKLAGEMAGLEVLRLVAEPTAAALAYGMDKLDERSRVAVFDLGGALSMCPFWSCGRVFLKCLPPAGTPILVVMISMLRSCATSCKMRVVTGSRRKGENAF